MFRLAPASRPTLRKAGADFRWLIEKSGVNPETALVTIGVPTRADRDRLSVTLVNEFDQECMWRDGQFDHIVEVFGLRIVIVALPEVKQIKIGNKPSESA